MNIECDGATLTELEGIFRFNDAVLRHLTLHRQEAVVEQSIMLKAKEEKDRSSRSYDDRDRDSRDDDTSDDQTLDVAVSGADREQVADDSTDAAGAARADA
jgi:small subunit ribosomal protein S6